jgi:16S rRNA (guanine527-N7)-methyltransferase
MGCSQETFPWESAISERARAAGLTLSDDDAARLAGHARAVLAVNELLHLTTITDPERFVERHLGESFEGAALLPAACDGPLVDLGSGNGYPGIPIAVVHHGLVPYLVEASAKKAAFLTAVLSRLGRGDGVVIDRNVARSDDLATLPPVGVLVTRAMGGWERIVPKLATRFATGGRVLIWGSTESEPIFRRSAWSRFRVEGFRPIPHRDRSVIYALSINN